MYVLWKKAHKPFVKHKCKNAIIRSMPAYKEYGCSCEEGIGQDWIEPTLAPLGTKDAKSPLAGNDIKVTVLATLPDSKEQSQEALKGEVASTR